MKKYIRDNVLEFMFCLWVISYVCNGLGYTKFELNSLWQGVTIMIGFIGSYWIKSKYNSEEGKDPHL